MLGRSEPALLGATQTCTEGGCLFQTESLGEMPAASPTLSRQRKNIPSLPGAQLNRLHTPAPFHRSQKEKPRRTPRGSKANLQASISQKVRGVWFRLVSSKHNKVLASLSAGRYRNPCDKHPQRAIKSQVAYRGTRRSCRQRSQSCSAHTAHLKLTSLAPGTHVSDHVRPAPHRGFAVLSAQLVRAYKSCQASNGELHEHACDVCTSLSYRGCAAVSRLPPFFPLASQSFPASILHKQHMTFCLGKKQDCFLGLEKYFSPTDAFFSGISF